MLNTYANMSSPRGLSNLSYTGYPQLGQYSPAAPQITANTGSGSSSGGATYQGTNMLVHKPSFMASLAVGSTASKAKQSKAKQSKAKQSKAKQSKAKQSQITQTTVYTLAKLSMTPMHQMMLSQEYSAASFPTRSVRTCFEDTHQVSGLAMIQTHNAIIER